MRITNYSVNSTKIHPYSLANFIQYPALSTHSPQLYTVLPSLKGSKNFQFFYYWYNFRYIKNGKELNCCPLDYYNEKAFCFLTSLLAAKKKLISFRVNNSNYVNHYRVYNSICQSPIYFYLY